MGRVIIDILCSDRLHPVFPEIEQWQKDMGGLHLVNIRTRVDECAGGDLLFLISCNEIIESEIRGNYSKTLVIHASDLPEGRGWSPLVWQILEGKAEIVVTLFEAADKVDDGDVWKKSVLYFEGNELVDEMNARLFEAEIGLMEFAVENFSSVEPVAQSKAGATYYRKRTPEDSRLDPDKTLREQFNLLRVADPERYPAFFDMEGCRYKLKIEKLAGGETETNS